MLFTIQVKTEKTALVFFHYTGNRVELCFRVDQPKIIRILYYILFEAGKDGGRGVHCNDQRTLHLPPSMPSWQSTRNDLSVLGSQWVLSLPVCDVPAPAVVGLPHTRSRIENSARPLVAETGSRVA